MFYNFPVIYNIDDIKRVISGKDEFRIYEKEHFDIVVYEVAFKDTFPLVENDDHALLRECRGIVFDKTGNVISRRFHKFFNVNERIETQNIDINLNHHILEKLDGSFLSPVLIDNNIQWITKRGHNKIGTHAAKYIEHSGINYNKFARYCISNNVTPIFEYMAAINRVIINYGDEPRLTLLAIRDNIHGNYTPYGTLVEVAKEFGIPVVKTLGKLTNSFINDSRSESGLEGYVVRYDNGHMVKIKNDWYCKLHKNKEGIIFEKNVWNLILTDQMDDQKALLPKEDVIKIEQYENEFYEIFMNYVQYLNDETNKIRNELKNSTNIKKDFNLTLANNYDNQIKQLFFRLLNNDDAVIVLKEFLLKNTNAASSIENIKKIIPFPKWKLDKFDD